MLAAGPRGEAQPGQEAGLSRRGRRCPPPQGQVSPVPTQPSLARDERFPPHPETRPAHQTAHGSVVAASAAPLPSPARCWSGLWGGNRGIELRVHFLPLDAFFAGAAFLSRTCREPSGKLCSQPPLSRQTDRQLPLSCSEKCGNKKQSGRSLSCLSYSGNLQASQNTWKSNIVSSCFKKMDLKIKTP